MNYNQYNNSGKYPEWKKYIPYYKYIILGIFLIILLVMTFFQIRPEEVGVITRFGKYIRQE